MRIQLRGWLLALFAATAITGVLAVGGPAGADDQPPPPPPPSCANGSNWDNVNCH